MSFKVVSPGHLTAGILRGIECEEEKRLISLPKGCCDCSETLLLILSSLEGVSEMEECSFEAEEKLYGAVVPKKRRDPLRLRVD